MHIGEKVKKRRKEIQMTQARLAEGICTQAMVSRIEKKSVKPSRDLMEQIARRLDISVHYFYNGQTDDSLSTKIAKLSYLIRKQLNKKEYEMVYYLLDSNKELIAQSSGEDRGFFDWIRSLLYAYKERDIEKALVHLVEMERNVRNGDLRLEVINSIGQLYLKKKEYRKAEAYFKEGVLSFAEWMDYEKKAALLLNYVITLNKQKKYNESLEAVFNGLELLIKKNTLIYLGDFFYYKGYCLEKLNQQTEALVAYQKAHTIFEIQNNDKYVLIIKLAQSNLEKYLSTK